MDGRWNDLITNSFVMRSERYHPTILRENKSMMGAKYSYPSFVRIYVISAHPYFVRLILFKLLIQ
jgi:hypothetical protein